MAGEGQGGGDDAHFGIESIEFKPLSIVRSQLQGGVGNDSQPFDITESALGQIFGGGQRFKRNLLLRWQHF